MIDVQNRTPLPGKAGRVTLALDDGTTLGGTLSMADEATQGGTPWDRDTARRLQADIRAYPVAAGQSITAGDVVDVVGGEVVGNKAPVGALASGTAILLNEGGAPVEYIIVNHGLPSAMYDATCNGTWALRKDIFEYRDWNSSTVGDWANSTLKAYLDSTFFDRFDSATQSAIKQVKIPYRVGSSGSSVNSGADGLSCKVFLLSGYELGWTVSNNANLPVDGAKLEYFDSGTTGVANSKRISKFNNIAQDWWMRSPHIADTTLVFMVTSSGSFTYASEIRGSVGVRPAIILDPSFEVTFSASRSQAIALTTATAGTNCEVIYSGVAALSGITEGQKITSDGVYGVGVLDGVLQVWSKDRPGQVVTGSYTGTGAGTVTLDFGVKPKFVVVQLLSAVSYARGGYVWLYGAHSGYVVMSTTASDQYVELTWTETGVSWYDNGQKLNGSGLTYGYIVIP